MPAPIKNLNDIVGNKYELLTVRRYSHSEMHGRQKEHYYCDCDCGNKDVLIQRHSLLKGDTKSCGCLKNKRNKEKTEDLTNQYFGRWHVLEQAPTRYSKSGKTRSIMWKCECECGVIKNVGARALKTAMSQSCGCLQKERVSEALTDDLTGKEFGLLKVQYRNGSHRKTNSNSGVSAVWHCACECGNSVDVMAFSLKNGDTTSCGCKKASKYEMYTAKYLDACGYVYGVDYFKEKTFAGLKGIGGQSLRFDFLVYLHNGETVLIECQGEQHYRSSEWYGGQEYFEKVRQHDAIKKDFAKNNNIRLIEVSYKDVLYSDVENRLKSNNVT